MVKKHLIVPILVILILSISRTSSFCQDITLGLLSINTSKTFVGYTLIAPSRSPNTYLIDNYGYVVHKWYNEFVPELNTVILDNGNLLRICEDQDPDVLHGTGFLREYDWDGNIVWEYRNKRYGTHLHHDFKRMPNGNTLIISQERFEYQECIDAGRKPHLFNDVFIYSEYILEVNPDKDIVWEWHFWDHLSADGGGIANGKPVSPDTTDPGKLNINYAPVTGADWIHINSIDYNPKLDQIILTSSFLNEIYIIDHSICNYTETEAGIEAAKGPDGDFIYRWGNPSAFGRGTKNDKMLFGVHNAYWIPEGNPGAGNILFYNNGWTRNVQYSSVDEIYLPLNNDNSYIIQPSLTYGPDDLVWTYFSENKTDFYSSFLSGAQRLPNGNTLMCEGWTGRILEVTYEGEVVWEYINPVTNSGPKPQGSILFSGNELYRAYRYPKNHPAFAGKKLTLSQPLEKYNILTSVDTDPGIPADFTLHQNYPNPFNPLTNICFELERIENVNLVIYNSLGNEVNTITDNLLTPGTYIFTWNGTNNAGSAVSTGVYFYRLTAGNQTETKKMIFMK
ncbi:aryl-sulfate sulfotransferase [candidate division KSB1 bacterium]